MDRLRSFILPPLFVVRLLTGAAGLALLSGFIAEHVFKLRPCSLCIIQQYFFIVICIIGACTFFSSFLKSFSKKIGLFLAFLLIVNASVACYQVAVEHHWVEAPNQCQSKKLSGNSIEELREQLLATETVRCDQVQWSLFGISMAGYNVFYCLFLGLYSLYFLRKQKI